MNVSCADCGTNVAADQTYFSAQGEVCSQCHAAESAHDSAQFAESHTSEWEFDEAPMGFSSGGGLVLRFDLSRQFGSLMRFLFGQRP